MDTIEQLRNHLKSSGYSQFLTRDEPTCVAVYDLCLEKSGSKWRVFETERGQEIASYIETSNESEATCAFLDIAAARIYLLQTSESIESIQEVEFLLRSADIPFQRNDVPFRNELRLFVAGSDLLKAHQIVPTSGT
ncbi:hypothetical protein [Sphingobium yanoikuyae]|uniref:hypothetical protein n=1 Tax=Sphingobium yanoikuyae TaxID=13690 RepID=UPI00056064B0|nr:hypothetical protein [Sphingobium yanoikuyae]